MFRLLGAVILSRFPIHFGFILFDFVIVERRVLVTFFYVRV